MKRMTFLLCLSCCLAFAFTAIAQTQYDYAHVQIGSADPTPLTGQSYFASTGSLICGVGDEKMVLIDYSNPMSPVFVSSMPLCVNVWDVEIRNEMAWIATTEGLYGVDIATPETPNLVVTYPLDAGIWDITTQTGPRLFAITGDGIHILDISDPTMPVLLDLIEGSFGRAAVTDEFLFTPVDGTIFSYDLSTYPAELVGEFATGYTRSIITLANGYLYGSNTRTEQAYQGIDLIDRIGFGVCEYAIGPNGHLEQTAIIKYPQRSPAPSNRYRWTTMSKGVGVIFTKLADRISVFSSPGLGLLAQTHGSSYLRHCSDNVLIESYRGNIAVHDISGTSISPIVDNARFSTPYRGAVANEATCYACSRIHHYDVHGNYVPMGTILSWDVRDGQLANEQLVDYDPYFFDETQGMNNMATTSPYFAFRWGGDDLSLFGPDPTLGRLNSFESSPAYTLGENRLYTTADPDYFYIYDITDPIAPVTHTHILSDFDPTQFVVVDNILYSLHDTAILGVMDVADAAAPVIYPNIELPAKARDFAVCGDYGYILTKIDAHTYLQVYSLADVTSPAPLGELELPASCNNLEAFDCMVYLASPTLGVVVVDATDPNLPIVEGTCYLEDVGELSVNSHGIYVPHSDGLALLSFSVNGADPTPTYLSTFTLADRDQYVDIQWRTAHEANLEDFRLMAYAGSTSWSVNIEWNGANFRAHDPVALNHAPGDIVYQLQVRDGGSWLTLIQSSIHLSPPALRVSLAEPYPNPFNPNVNLSFTRPTAGHTTLAIVDLAGRRVATLVDEHLGAGQHNITWQGDDDGGQSAAAGTYLVQLQAGVETQTKKVTLVK